MNTHYVFGPGLLYNSSSTVLSNPTAIEHHRARALTSSFWVRLAVKISRARWFNFLRRVFHYQNGSGSRSNHGSNPFNSRTWMMLELVALFLQLSISTFILAISKKEKPVWPMRVWIIGYNISSFLSLLLLCGRYRRLNLAQNDDFNLLDMEQQRSIEESRMLHLTNKCCTTLELFFAIWFVMGNVWVFDSRFGSFPMAPKLHVLCISLLAYNAICYSFPFLLFLLLCCCVPLISTLLGYNMNMGSIDRGASDDQLARLLSRRYKSGDSKSEHGIIPAEDPECCICLAKYGERDEIRELPCAHVFHLNCVDQWLRIISICPLCKQELER